MPAIVFGNEVLKHITELKNHNSVGPDRLSAQVFKLGGEAMTMYPMWLHPISINNFLLLLFQFITQFQKKNSYFTIILDLTFHRSLNLCVKLFLDCAGMTGFSSVASDCVER